MKDEDKPGEWNRDKHGEEAEDNIPLMQWDFAPYLGELAGVWSMYQEGLKLQDQDRLLNS